MAGELVDDWKRLSLTEAEDEIIEFEPEQGEEVHAQPSLCLIEKLHTSNVFNPEALKQTMPNVWKPSHGLVIMDLDHNLFAFQFFSLGDMDYMLEEGPWAFDGHVLLLKELDIHEQPSKIEFTSARFWVKIYDLPMSMQNLKLVEQMGNNIGRFVEADQTDILVPSKALKIKVDWDLQKPLRRGLMLKLNGTQTWFKMKYVKLPDFCYAYGLLGHVYRRCELYNPDVPESDLQYGSWLRATPTKKKTKDHKREILQERHRLLGLGRSGGLAMLWKKSLRVTLLSCSSNHVDILERALGLHIPPRMKAFIWRACTDALPSKSSMSLKVHDMDASCMVDVLDAIRRSHKNDVDLLYQKLWLLLKVCSIVKYLDLKPLFGIFTFQLLHDVDLLLIDEDRAIQVKFHALGAKVAFAESDADVECSRNLFREAVPFLLRGRGGDHWVFSQHQMLPSSVTGACNLSGGCKVVEHWLWWVGSRLANCWSALFKMGADPCGLGEGPSPVGPKVEGIA
ncbi:LOW QUALITY PROTEIN: hypothetical protein Cgig2_028000 [Carnegiea gigantea]|uniref:DUF4283 domain-containing protein n=1 Tax=Carnegiea gigantea TaxID=171969 RepID=A0A9Q1GWQ9_9CARY|nr:LOW QUALITY PROTEIN: hypothetical protein Cgig2_028000 [Carnegiea gigantea]